MGSEATKNDEAWEALFNRYDIPGEIARKGFFEITATQINEKREARLMTKFDHRINLPALFSKNRLAILPVTRGSYVIAPFDAYKAFEESTSSLTRIPFPNYVESLNPTHITSEAAAINCAYLSGMFTDFLGEEQLLPTVSGRMGSGSFAFKIRESLKKTDLLLQVNSSQMEIDGGYEGPESLTLIEAKNFLSEDFLVRQLYYPFRFWSGAVRKPVRCVFLVYTNGVFSLYEYVFADPEHYNSLELVKHKNYSIDAEAISQDEIRGLLPKLPLLSEPELAFPQADSLKRVINLCELLMQGEKSRDEITLNYAFDPRQTNYYTDAGRYLGLIGKRHEGREPLYFMTEEGRRTMDLPYKLRQLSFARAILSHGPFRKTYEQCLKEGRMPSRTEIADIMRTCGLHQVEKESTYLRRASTVAGWVKWILDLSL